MAKVGARTKHNRLDSPLVRKLLLFGLRPVPLDRTAARSGRPRGAKIGHNDPGHRQEAQ